MKISQDEVEQVAMLARLALTEEELNTNTEQLNSILEYAAILDKVNTDNIEPTIYGVSLRNVFREDLVIPSMNREKALANAPESEDGFFKVPRIL